MTRFSSALRPASSPARAASPSRALLADRRGLATVEYTIALVLVAVGAIAVWTNLGDALVEKVEYATHMIQQLGL